MQSLPSSTFRNPKSQSHELCWIKVTLNNRPCIALIDSGAQGKFVSSRLIQQEGWKSPPNKEVCVQLPNGNIIKGSNILNAAVLGIGNKNYEQRINFHILTIEVDLILGITWLKSCNPNIDWTHSTMKIGSEVNGETIPFIRRCKNNVTLSTIQDSADKFAKFEVIPNIHINSKEVVQDEGLQEILLEFKEVFPDKLPKVDTLKQKPFRHQINLIPNSEIPRQPVYRLTKDEENTLKQTLNDLLTAGFIRESESTQGAPTIFVKKKEGGMRLCIDYRALNRITKKNLYPLPRIDELIDQLGQATYFTKLDLQSGYYQIPMEENDIEKTAFRTKFGLFEFTVMPFGLKNAPATFQKTMNKILEGFLQKFVIVYLDDILIYSKDLKQHYCHLRMVLKALESNNFYYKISKCQFAKTELPYLGFIISKGGAKTDPTKVKAIRDWPTVQNKQQIQSFMGLVNFYRRFIPKFADIAEPIVKLTRKVAIFEWDESREAAFQYLKELLTTAPILKYPDLSNLFRVETDASQFSVGGVLLQEAHGSWLPVSYHLRGLTPAERNYLTYEKELLALINCVKLWRHYLLGQVFTVYTDHSTLQYFISQPKVKERHSRWVAILSEFHINIVYKKGTKNLIADPLSRRPDLQVISPLQLNNLTRLLDRTQIENDLSSNLTFDYEHDTSFSWV